MNREKIIEKVSNKLKLIRTEYSYTQDQMALYIGVSKKTLVQIEKERIECNWSVAVSICTLFRKSHVLQNMMGGDPVEILELTVHSTLSEEVQIEQHEKVWWETIEKNMRYRLEKNMLSNHYRVVNKQDYRIFCSVDEQLARNYFMRVCS